MFKKQEHCDPDDPADDHHGDWWDHVAIDAETRLVLGVVPGARDAENVEEVVGEVKQRTGGRMLELMTSDDYPAYETAILAGLRAGRRDHADRPAEPPDDPQEGPAAGAELRHGGEETGEGPRGGDHHPGGLRDDGGRAGGAGAVAGQPVGSTCRSWSGRTRRTGTATPGRSARPTRSRRIGVCTRR